jgi:hypothetical protein
MHELTEHRLDTVVRLLEHGHAVDWLSDYRDDRLVVIVMATHRG